MDLLTAAVVILAFSALLLVVGRSFERKRMKVEVMLMSKDDMSSGLPDRRPIGDVQAASGNPVENVFKRVQAKSQAKTDEEMLKAVRKRDELLGALTSLKNASTRSTIETTRLRADLIRAEDEVERLIVERANRAAEAEAAKRPSIPSELDNIKTENEALKLKAERLQLQMKLSRLQAEHNSTMNPPGREGRKEEPPQDPLEQALQEFFRQVRPQFEKKQRAEEIKGPFLDRARKWAEAYGYDPDRVEREAKKYYEEHYKRP